MNEYDTQELRSYIKSSKLQDFKMPQELILSSEEPEEDSYDEDDENLTTDRSFEIELEIFKQKLDLAHLHHQESKLNKRKKLVPNVQKDWIN